MAKLPVNFLLYTLYAASAGLIGGIGWTFYSTYKLKERFNDLAFRKEINSEVDKQVKLGRDSQPERKAWSYATTEWWQQFSKVNITGKLPPEPEKPPEKVEEPPAVDQGVPLENIIVLESLLLEVSKATKQASHIVVRYKDGVEVHPPPDLVAGAGTAPAPAKYTPGDTPRPPGGPTPTPSPIPMAAAGRGELRQVVRIGETLWPPYNNLHLVGIADDAQSADFLREDPKKDRAEWKKEPPLFKNELDLDPEVMRVLRGDQRRGKSGDPAAGAQPTPVPGNEVSDWRDPPDTTEVTPRNVHLSRKDHDYIRDNVEKVFNDEVAVTSYKARVGNYEGLRLDRLSPRLQGFGFQPGDIILKVNGESVKNRANAYSVSKRQYENGARQFVVEYLSHRGTGVEKKTLVAPKN